MYCLSFARDSGEGKLKGKNMARCHTGDHRRQPSPWITFVSNHRAFNGLFLWSNTEFSTVWIEFPEQGKYIPLVFHGQELMNLWKVNNANKSHVFKGQDCSQLSHTSAFPSRWDQNQPTFKGGIRASWELLVRNFLPKHFQVKTAMQDCYQRTAAILVSKTNFKKLIQKIILRSWHFKRWQFCSAAQKHDFNILVYNFLSN